MVNPKQMSKFVVELYWPEGVIWCFIHVSGPHTIKTLVEHAFKLVGTLNASCKAYAPMQ